MAHRFLLTLLMVVAMVFGPVAMPLADHSSSDPDSDAHPSEESIAEMGEELARVLADHLHEFLQRELNRLKKGTLASNDELREQIKKYEAEIAQNPDDPESRFILGQIYDEIGDGASAIIQTKMAEELYLRDKNMKGIAECRRNLRRYYKDYGYRPDDFILIR